MRPARFLNVLAHASVRFIVKTDKTKVLQETLYKIQKGKPFMLCPLLMQNTLQRHVLLLILVISGCSTLSLADDRDNRSSSPNESRVLLRKALPQGLSVELNTLGPYRYIQVNFRARAGDYTNDDPSLGAWAIQIPELIGNSDGFIFGFNPNHRWLPVPDKPNSIYYENESHPISPDEPVAFAGLPEMINRDGRMKYRAQVSVDSDRVDIELALTNLEDKATSFFVDICNRFYGRGNVWGWSERTYVKVRGEWILPRRLFAGEFGPRSVRWFVKARPPGPNYQHEFFRNSANNPAMQIMESPYICMPLQNGLHTIMYGSPQGSMVFFNPDNPCTHSDAWTPDVAPGQTVVQRTSLRVYRLPRNAAIKQFEQEMKTVDIRQ